MRKSTCISALLLFSSNSTFVFTQDQDEYFSGANCSIGVKNELNHLLERIDTYRGVTMSGPARAGGLIYAKNIETLSAFYEDILSMKKVRSSHDLIVLISPDFQLLIHAIPAHISSQMHIKCPPELREQTSIKLFFTVSSISQARSKAAAMGGAVFSERWDGPGFHVCNAYDPEGNIFQVRENAL